MGANANTRPSKSGQRGRHKSMQGPPPPPGRGPPYGYPPHPPPYPMPGGYLPPPYPMMYPGAPFPPGPPMPPYMVRPPMQAPYGAPRGPPSGPTAPPLHLPRGLPAFRKKVDDDKDKPPEEQSMKVFVGKLPSDVPDSFLCQLYENCGRVRDWIRKVDPQTNRPSSFGFCTFDKPESARRAVKVLNAFRVDYQEIQVKLGKKEEALLEELKLPETPEKDEEALKNCQRLIANRNIVIQGEAGEGEEVEGEVAQEGVLNEIEKFRQRQAVRDKEKDDERRRELKRKLEETSRQERANADREERDAKERSRREQASAAVAARSPPRHRSRSRSRDRDGKRSREDRSRDRESASSKAEAVVQAALGGGTSALPPPPPHQGEGGEKSSKGREQASEGKDKDAIFRYQMDWAAIDRHQVVERKMRAWVVKKIKEYLGEEETTLIKFIMHHLAAHCKPEDLLTELRLVLEDDADIFVEKLWKVLIYHMVNAGQ